MLLSKGKLRGWCWNIQSNGFACMKLTTVIAAGSSAWQNWRGLIWLSCDTNGRGEGCEAARPLTDRFLNHGKLQSARRFCGAIQVTGRFPLFVLQSIGIWRCFGCCSAQDSLWDQESIQRLPEVWCSKEWTIGVPPISISSSKGKFCRRRDIFITPLRQSSDREWLCAMAFWSLVCGDRHPEVTSTASGAELATAVGVTVG